MVRDGKRILQEDVQLPGLRLVRSAQLPCVRAFLVFYHIVADKAAHPLAIHGQEGFHNIISFLGACGPRSNILRRSRYVIVSEN